MFSFLLLLLFILSIACNNFIDYGIYCGYLHTSEYGLEPIDELDRYCQFHDICTSQGLLDCFCNEQLYYYVSNYKPIDNVTLSEKNSILKAIYLSVVGCTNMDQFDIKFKLGKRSNKGFNYLPIYKSDQNYKYSGNVKIYKFDNVDNLLTFTKYIHDNLPNVNNVNNSELSSGYYYILYNGLEEFVDVYVKKIDVKCQQINPYITLFTTLFILYMIIGSFIILSIILSISLLIILSLKYKKKYTSF